MNWEDCRRKPLGPNLKYGNPKCKQFREVRRKPNFAQLRTRYTTFNCLCTEPDTLASTKVRRISGLKRASFPCWTRKSIPRLRGPGPLNDNRRIVGLRKPHLFDTDSFGVKFWIRLTVMYYCTINKSLNNIL